MQLFIICNRHYISFIHILLINWFYSSNEISFAIIDVNLLLSYIHPFLQCFVFELKRTNPIDFFIDLVDQTEEGKQKRANKRGQTGKHKRANKRGQTKEGKQERAVDFLGHHALMNYHRDHFL